MEKNTKNPMQKKTQNPREKKAENSMEKAKSLREKRAKSPVKKPRSPQERAMQRIRHTRNPDGEVPPEYFEWELERQYVRYESDKRSWLREVDSKTQRVNSLKAENAALKRELVTSNRDRDTFKEQLTAAKKEIKTLEKDNFLREERRERKEQRLSKKLAEVKQKLTVNQEGYEEIIEKLSTQLEKCETSMRADFEKRLTLCQDEKNRKLQEERDEYQTIMEQLKETNDQYEQKIKHLSVALERERADSEGALVRQRLKQHLEREEIQSKHRSECSRLQMMIKSHARYIHELRNREDLTPKLNKAQETIRNKNETIKMKNREIETLKMEKKGVLEKLSDEMDNYALIKASLTNLKEQFENLQITLEEEQKKLRAAKEDLNEATQKNSMLIKRNEFLDYKLSGSEPQREKLKFRVSDMETYLLRLKEDIQAIMPFIHKPKELKKRFIYLKTRYVDGDEKVPIDENTRLGMQHQVDCLKKKFVSSLAANKSLVNELKNCELRFQSNVLTAHKQRMNLIECVNEQKLKARRAPIIHPNKNSIRLPPINKQRATLVEGVNGQKPKAHKAPIIHPGKHSICLPSINKPTAH